jgi:dTDP-4-amino-4,6-dideoxygalactose transaminase
MVAAFLAAQLDEAESITARRMAIWDRYHAAFVNLEATGQLRRPIVPEDCTHNAHMYYLLLPDLDARTAFIEHMKARDIQCVFHYVPLHSAPYGRRVGRTSGQMVVTDDIADRLVRLPLWVGLEEHLDRVIEAALGFFRGQ